MHLYIAACLVQFKKETIVYPDWMNERMNEWMNEGMKDYTLYECTNIL